MPAEELANGHTISTKAMWLPSPDKLTHMKTFMTEINDTYGLKLETYRDLWKWSVEHYGDFWKEMWRFGGIISSQPYEEVVDVSKSIVDNPQWFKGSLLNYAENMMRFNDDKVALISTGEGQTVKQITHKQFHGMVAHFASALKKLGIKQGDRVVGYIPNCIEAVVAMLATASMGAIWSSTSPDFGVKGVLERFQQITPKLIFSVEAIRYNAKVHNHLEKLSQVANGLPELKHVIVIPFVEKNAENIDISSVPNSMTLGEFLANGSPSEALEFKQLPFNHPLFVMYSSGTTGPPKCMVHSAGGTLIKHLADHIVHGNMDREDIMFYYTTTGWMMFNWMVGSLPCGGAIVLYDGSPFQPTATSIFDVVEKLGVTILGTSAKCLDIMEGKGLTPFKTHNLKKLRTILSTGSPLAPHQYDYVYEHVKPDVLLASITGGTDIISTFMSQNATVPVYRGELQSADLGMAVYCFEEDENGEGRVVYGRPGELVCTKPFPNMPVYFWNDHDGALYKKAYFSNFPGVWSHGDFCMENERTHGFVMLGRSDATLNPNGVRFGSSEIYTIIEEKFRNEVSDCLAVAQRPKFPCKDPDVSKQKNNERVILFLVMAPGVILDNELIAKIRKTIRSLISPRHVPEVILDTDDIPYTISGKKIEIAVARILAGMEVNHRGALRNPEALDLYKDIPALKDY